MTVNAKGIFVLHTMTVNAKGSVAACHFFHVLFLQVVQVLRLQVLLLQLMHHGAKVRSALSVLGLSRLYCGDLRSDRGLLVQDAGGYILVVLRRTWQRDRGSKQLVRIDGWLVTLHRNSRDTKLRCLALRNVHPDTIGQSDWYHVLCCGNGLLCGSCCFVNLAHSV